jgi:hypothetical protein
MKTGEIDYLQNLGSQGSNDAFDKPFSDAMVESIYRTARG